MLIYTVGKLLLTKEIIGVAEDIAIMPFSFKGVVTQWEDDYGVYTAMLVRPAVIQVALVAIKEVKKKSKSNLGFQKGEFSMNNKIMNFDRLKLLEQYLRGSQVAEKWGFDEWACFDRNFIPERDGGKNPEVDFFSCGTAGCAAGQATTIPEFKAAGLRLIAVDYSNKGTPSYRGWSGLKAMSEFFNLDDRLAQAIFITGANGNRGVKITPIDVANRIKRLLDVFPDGKTALEDNTHYNRWMTKVTYVETGSEESWLKGQVNPPEE